MRPVGAVHNGRDMVLRVYCVDDTLAAIHAVHEEEQRIGGIMVADAKEISVELGNGDLFVSVDACNDAWRVRRGGEHQEIPMRHVWETAQLLHCSIALDAMHDVSMEGLQARLVVGQTESETRKRDLCGHAERERVKSR